MMMHTKSCILLKGVILTIVGLLWLGGDLGWWNPLLPSWTTWIALLVFLAGLNKLFHGAGSSACYEMNK